MLQFQLTPHSTTEILLTPLNILHQNKHSTKHVPSDAHFINNQHSTPITQPRNQTSSLRCAPHQHLTLNTHHPSNIFPQMRTSSTPNTQHLSPVKHVPSDAHFINTYHPSNMFPRMRTSSTTNTQHPTPKHKTCSLGCALHHHLTFNSQHPSRHLHIIITQKSTPNTQHRH